MKEIDWKTVKRVLIVKLRSIGDTVLATPSISAIRRFLPDAQIDVLLEDWVAPVLEGLDGLTSVIPVGNGSLQRLKVMNRLRRERYDVAFNLHGGTTSTFFTAASRSRHRVGWAEYQYSFLYNHLYPSAAEFWGRSTTHSAEQQLALLGYAGIPVRDRPKSRLTVLPEAMTEMGRTLGRLGLFEQRIALIHPAAAFATKQWPSGNFARVAEFVKGVGLSPVLVVASNERSIIEAVRNASDSAIDAFADLTLPEITALASRSALFVGNDSGIAHIAAAVNTPSVVIFGSSNRGHWRPWTDAPNEVVYKEFSCQPCPGYECREFGEPRCIQEVQAEQVFAAIEKVLNPAGPS